MLINRVLKLKSSKQKALLEPYITVNTTKRAPTNDNLEQASYKTLVLQLMVSIEKHRKLLQNERKNFHFTKM